MKKRVTVILEVETDDDISISDKFIRNDLEQEISCASNHYDVISIQTEVLDDEFICTKLADFLANYYKLKDQNFSQTEIAKSMGMTTTVLRAKVSYASDTLRREKGYSTK